MKSVKNIVGMVVVFLILFGVFYGLFLISKYQTDKRKERIAVNRKIVAGKIIITGSMKGSYAIAAYFDGNRRFTVHNSSPADDVQTGQWFQVEYDSTNPSVSNILFEYPLFKKKDVIDSTSGTVIQHSKYSIRFKYEINGVIYKKFQGLKEGQTIENGQIFKVQYLSDTPSIALIRLPYLKNTVWQ